MGAILHFARTNFQKNTGGPFAAGVFEQETGRLISIGVNRVVPSHCSSAHAEIIALSLAQKRLETFDLGAPHLPALQLVVNWRPCAMCYGATIWSGVRSLVVAGDGPELEEITGFDEGPVVEDWIGELNKRGITVINNILREHAIQVYKEFRDSQSFVYNARQGAS